MPKLKLTYTTTFTLEVDSEEELQIAMANMPWIGKQPGFTSAQSHAKVIEGVPVKQLSSLADVEKDAVVNALEGRSKTDAAKILGITRATLYNKIEEYQL